MATKNMYPVQKTSSKEVSVDQSRHFGLWLHACRGAVRSKKDAVNRRRGLAQTLTRCADCLVLVFASAEKLPCSVNTDPNSFFSVG